jgi:hypothetical protein
MSGKQRGRCPQFIDFVVRIETVRATYPGGWERCLADHSSLTGCRVWYHEHLLRDGAMSSGGIACLIDAWTALGFVPTEEVGGERRWKDVCIVEVMLGRTTLPCPWLDIDWSTRSVFLRGTSRDTLIGRRRGA